MKKEETLPLSDEKTALENKEAIKRSILDSAALSAAKIIAAAEAECQKLLEGAQADIACQREENHKRAAAKAEEIALRKNMAAKLECKKYELFEKQRLVSAVYDAVLKELESMPVEDYKRLFAKKVKGVAEKGDQVLLTKGEKKLDAAWLEQINREIGFQLVFSQDTHGQGGVILRGSICDKNLTHAVLIKEAREKTEGEVIKRLFEN